MSTHHLIIFEKDISEDLRKAKTYPAKNKLENLLINGVVLDQIQSQHHVFAFEFLRLKHDQ